MSRSMDSSGVSEGGDGVKTVSMPVEPTEPMIAAVFALDIPPINGHDLCENDLLLIYRAMVKANQLDEENTACRCR